MDLHEVPGIDAGGTCGSNEGDFAVLAISTVFPGVDDGVNIDLILVYLEIWRDCQERFGQCDICDDRLADIIRWLYYTCKQEGKD